MESITQTANPAGAASSSSVSTYSGVSIGTAASNRVVVVCVTSEIASASINSCTIDYGSGDTAMTAGTQGNQTNVYARVFRLAVPTGTTATIKVTYGAAVTANQNHISVYRILDSVYSSTGADQSTDMDATDPLTTGSTTVGTGGLIIAVACGATDTVAKTWANITEDIDADAGSHRHTTAFSTTAGTATRTCTGGTDGEDGALSWFIFTDNTSPTVALNSPSDTASTGDLTPTLNFTGTDTDSDAVEYEVQVDTANTFDGVILASDNFNRADENPIGGNWTNNALGEGANNQLKIVSNQLKAVTATTSCEAYWNAGTFTGDIEQYFTIVTKPGNTQRVEMGFIKEPGSATYDGYVCYFNDNAGTDTVHIDRIDNAAATQLATVDTEYSNGDILSFHRQSNGVFTAEINGTVVLTTSVDVAYTGAFYAYVCIRDTTGVIDNWGVKSPLIDALSTTDVGFTAGHPFASGAATDYTVQSDLTASTVYYWRVRAIDPAGSNSYGAWSSTRSFTATAPAGSGAKTLAALGVG